MKHNEHELEKIKNITDKIGVNQLQLKTVQKFMRKKILTSSCPIIQNIDDIKLEAIT